MRIIAGKHRSRNLLTLEGDDTRPTSDKVKGALFSSLGSLYVGETILDLFGGSGAIALEGISRGAKHADIVDANYQAGKIMKQNISILKEDENVNVFIMDFKQALQQLQDKRYGFIFVDPPYALPVIDDVLEFIDKHQMLKAYGMLVVENDLKFEVKDCYSSFSLFKVKEYRKTKLIYYKGEKHDESNLSRNL